jgi:hypothetical protein
MAGEMKKCAISDCGRERMARGLCQLHWQRAYRAGALGEHPLTTRARGEGCLQQNGYIRKQVNGVAKDAHIFVAEKALGKLLPKGAVVHHVNEDKLDNRSGNLVICPDRAYHQLIHQRMRALKACGQADWRKCNFCKKYDAPGSLFIGKKRVYHRACNAQDQSERKRNAVA